jgi:hypothetical protein
MSKHIVISITTPLGTFPIEEYGKDFIKVDKAINFKEYPLEIKDCEDFSMETLERMRNNA